MPDPRNLARTLPRGTGLIFRHYADPNRETLAMALADLCRARSVPCLIAGDWRLAARAGADGLHVPETMIPVRTAWRRARPNWIVTGAAHSLPAAYRAQLAGLDAVFLSPVFPTKSHPGAATLGPLKFSALTRKIGLPVFALGGMNPDRAQRLRRSGAAGWAGIRIWIR